MAAAINIHRNGQGMTSKKQQNSPIISYVKTLGEDVEVYSNGFDAIRILTKKEAVSIPRHTNPNSRLKMAGYEDLLNIMCSKVKKGDAVVIYYDSIHRWYLPTLEQVVTTCEIPLLRKLEDGQVYGIEK
jgi:hypothetical protein